MHLPLSKASVSRGRAEAFIKHFCGIKNSPIWKPANKYAQQKISKAMFIRENNSRGYGQLSLKACLSLSTLGLLVRKWLLSWGPDFQTFFVSTKEEWKWLMTLLTQGLKKWQHKYLSSSFCLGHSQQQAQDGWSLAYSWKGSLCFLSLWDAVIIVPSVSCLIQELSLYILPDEAG